MIRILILLSLLTAPLAWAQKPTSFYSTTDIRYSAVIESSELEKEPEIDYFRHICPGYGGYELVHLWGDARSWINVKLGKKETNLYSETMTHAGGAFPVVSHGVVEWRGFVRDGSFHPFAIIYRIEASGEEPDSVISKLFVVALGEGEAKFLGTASGKDENEKARQLADAYWESKG